MKYLRDEEVLFLHNRLIEETGGAHGVRDLNLLLSALFRPRATFKGKPLYPDLFSKAAALMESLARNHPFVNGNKRTAFSTACLFLERNGHRLKASTKSLVELTSKVATGSISLPLLTR